jgi:hypothetical protein
VLALRPIGIRTSSILGLTLLLGACFDPDPTPLTSESDGTTAGDPTAGTTCDPGEEQACTCEDGSAGTQTCSADGSGFGACECEAADSTSAGIDPSTTTDESTGPPPECTEASDCNMAKGIECQIDICTDGVCLVEYEPDGTECGDRGETECDLPDSCFRGECVANEAPVGTACSDCDTGVCSCAGGICSDCDALAPENNFITARSIDGWTLTGGWGLYRQAPQNFDTGPAVFSSQVLGTDGNRVAPYPGSETETSSARSRPFVLPATLDFLSWNVDEGSGVDTKEVNVSVDGGVTFTTVVACTDGIGGPQPFCNSRGPERTPDDWDSISIPVPPELVGQVGIIELTYDTLDPCCGFEKGWYIDVANLATECACTGDEGCAELGGECGTGVCGGSGECELDAIAAGQACGDATDVECNASDACDGVGYCASLEAVTGLTECNDCPAGEGSCNACQAGECVDCQSFNPINTFNGGLPGGWAIQDLGVTGADWQIVNDAPLNLMPGSVPVPLSFAPSFGTDGNRQAPYPGTESEHSRVTTAPAALQSTIEFSSWNVDEGGEGGPYDVKIIELSVDGGVSWNVLVDCAALVNVQPFCTYRDDTRLGDDWDEIVLDTSVFAGLLGQLRFTYNTGDSCCDFERGWYIDNLVFGSFCADSPFP